MLDATSSDSRVARRFGLWLAAGAIVLYSLNLSSFFRFYGDSALYLGLGRSLAESGKYAFNHSIHTFGFPGLPLMLAPIYALAGENFFLMNLLIAACAVGAIVMTYLLLRRLPLSRMEIVLCAILVACSRSLYYQAGMIMTDVPFMFLALAALYCGDRSRRVETWTWLIAAMLLAVAATAMRPMGAAVIFALVAAQWLDPGRLRREEMSPLPALDAWLHPGPVSRRLIRSAILLLPLVLLGAVGLWFALRHGADHKANYYTLFIKDRGIAGIAAHAWRSVDEFIRAFPETITGVRFRRLPYALPFLILPILGFAASWRRGERLLALYALASIAMVCVGEPKRRYLVPILPALAVWTVLGIRTLFQWVFWERRARLATCAVSGCLIAVNLWRVADVIRDKHVVKLPEWKVIASADEAAYFRLLPWLKENTPPGGTVVIYEWRMTHYFTRLKTRKIDVDRKSGGIVRGAPSYVVRDPKDDPAGTAILDCLIAQRPDVFARVHEEGHLTVYRVELAPNDEYRTLNIQ